MEEYIMTVGPPFSTVWQLSPLPQPMLTWIRSAIGDKCYLRINQNEECSCQENVFENNVDYFCSSLNKLCLNQAKFHSCITFYWIAWACIIPPLNWQIFWYFVVNIFVVYRFRVVCTDLVSRTKATKYIHMDIWYDFSPHITVCLLKYILW